MKRERKERGRGGGGGGGGFSPFTSSAGSLAS